MNNEEPKPNNSSSSSDESSSSSSQSSESMSHDLDIEMRIEVPESVIKRFFSKELFLQEFCTKASKTSFLSLITDVCKTYKLIDDSYNEMTELSYILFERLKSHSN